MMKLATLLVALTTACTVDTTPVLHRVQAVPGTAENRLNIVEQNELHDLVGGFDPSICDLLPSDGVCADACDPDALDQLIPPNVCALIACQLTDGRVVNIGACN